MNDEKQKRGPPDMRDIMVRLAEIRQEVEREHPEPRFPTKILRLLLILLVLALIPLVLTWPCKIVQEQFSGIEVETPAQESTVEVMPRPAR